MAHTEWDRLNAAITRCRLCPRLREHCEGVALTRRAAYRDEDYWGRPVPNFGSADARLLIVGLAPGAHGANRTGRMFTGDRSGDFLYSALYATGFATQPHATARGDGLELCDAAITAAAHCAPPDNKPTREELATCAEHLLRTVRIMSRLRVCVALGGVAFTACLTLYRGLGLRLPRPTPRFAHGALYAADSAPTLIASYHPSQQNTFTGRLTLPMLTDIFAGARKLIAA